MELKPGYKLTEVGVIPEDWLVKSLGELGQLKNGINKGKDDFGHGSPFINLMDVFGIPKVSTLTTEFGLVNTTTAEQTLYELKGGDVLFVRSSVKPEGVGLTALIPKDLPHTVFSGFLIRFRDSGLLELGFKEHCFWNEDFRTRLISNSTVSANANINQDALKRLQIAFPPNFPEQRSIATALSDMDELLGGLDRLITKKLDLKQSAMQQLLTGKTRLPGFDGEWAEKKIGTEIDLLTGYPFPSDQYFDSGIKLLRGSNIKRGVTDWSDELVQHWPKVTLDLHKYILNEGDIVIAMDGSLVGRSFARLSTNDLPALLLQRVARIRSHQIDMGYLKEWMCSKFFTQHCDSVKTVTAIPHISPGNIKNFIIQIPPTQKEQAAIASILSDMDTEITTLEQRRNKTRDLKQAMMQELLTGRIRLLSHIPHFNFYNRYLDSFVTRLSDKYASKKRN